MKRKIAGFHQDAERHWVADLACGHTQHMRHQPPWQERPWVVTEKGRNEKLGAEIECPLCDMPELPAGAKAYKRTATFTEATIPVGLVADHRTSADVWAKIVVESGELEYSFGVPPRTFVLTPERFGIAEPRVPHQARPLGAVRFFVEFYRRGT